MERTITGTVHRNLNPVFFAYMESLDLNMDRFRFQNLSVASPILDLRSHFRTIPYLDKPITRYQHNQTENILQRRNYL